MATNRRTRTASSSSALVVQQLADLFRANGHRLAVRGDSKVCFTSESLTLLNNYFQTANLDPPMPISNGAARTTSLASLPQPTPIPRLTIDTKLRENLVFLHDFLRKIQVVKLIHNSATLQGNVLLYPFRNVVCLEIKKIPVHMILGLSEIRHQLDTLICSMSIEKIEDLICACGGDSDEAQNWPRLKSLLLSHNTIERIDTSLKYLPALEILDLSHNRLQDCSKILDIVPHLKHLNLSSNHLRNLPLWSSNQGVCNLLTLKMRQNSLEHIKGIEQLKSLEELDLSDNFIINIPEEIRQLSLLKRVFFAHNPFTYDTNYRQKLILHLPLVFNQTDRELNIDNLPLTAKEKQKIPLRRARTSDTSQGFRVYSPTSTPIGTTTSESTTEGESITPSSIGSTVTRRRPNRRTRKGGRLQTPDPEITPTENLSSNSDTETTKRRPRRLNRVVESTQEIDNNYVTTVQRPSITTSAYSSGTVDPDETSLKITSSTTMTTTSTVPRKLTGDFSQPHTRRKSPRSRKVDQPTRIVLDVVDIPHSDSDATPEPGSPPLLSKPNPNYQTPIPVLEPNVNNHDDHLAGDSIRTTFFVIDNENRSLMIDLEPMNLIERDINNEDHLEKIKYSLMKLSIVDEDNPKKVEFTFEKKRNEILRRTYLFDTIYDQKSFVDEVERHLEMPTTLEFEPVQTQFVECSKCGKTFPPLHSMSSGKSPICISCQNPPTTEIVTGLQLNTTVEVTPDETELDHRLHFQVATEHFSHDNEQIKFHFKCFAVRSTTSKYFIAQTIITDHGIYIFQCDPATKDTESQFVLVGKDLLTNVLMLDIGYRLQTFTIELQAAAFAFLLADQQKTQKIVNQILEVLSPIVQSGEGALQKISRISSDEYRQRLFEIIKLECLIDDPSDDMIDFYSIIIRRDQTGNSQMIALLLLENWILMIEDEYAMIDSRHVRLPSPKASNENQQLKCDLMHLVNVINCVNHPKLFVFDFVDESETKQFRWRLEALSNESKSEFLTKVRSSYKKFMDIPMPETAEVV